MFSTLKAYAYAFGMALLGLAGAMLYRMGGKSKEADIKEDDYENAEDIRRRVSVDRADKLRKLDDAGWRD